MRELTADDLRTVVARTIEPSISIHRTAREERSDDNLSFKGRWEPPTDEEVDDFILSNPNLDQDLREQLTDPGLLGFAAKRARASDNWIKTFGKDIDRWVVDAKWLRADFPWLHDSHEREPEVSDLWTPDVSVQPPWVTTSPSCVLVAADLLRQGRLLSELTWRDFEKLVGELLESDGWSVEVTKQTRDGGIDVVASRDDPTVGKTKSLWQAKRYGPKSKVRLHEVRELSALREEFRATKAMVVTTNRLTRDAVAWIRRDIYRLGYKEHDDMAEWIRGKVLDV